MKQVVLLKRTMMILKMNKPRNKPKSLLFIYLFMHLRSLKNRYLITSIQFVHVFFSFSSRENKLHSFFFLRFFLNLILLNNRQTGAGLFFVLLPCRFLSKRYFSVQISVSFSFFFVSLQW